MNTAAPAPPATDAWLEVLETDAGPVIPVLDKNRTKHVISVPAHVAAVRVKASANDPNATVRIDGSTVTQGQLTAPLPVAADRNIFAIEITAADGVSKRTVELKVIRARPTIDWTRLLERASFHIRDSQGELVFNGRMWIIGGYTPRLVTDVWSSADGVAWEQTGSIPDESGINIPVQFVFDNKMWVSGNTGILYASPDGRTWTPVGGRAPWAGRYAAGSAVFAGRMWVLGGNSDGVLHNDVWSSADGIEWTLETAEAGWSKRQLFGGVVVHDEKLWVIGGGVTVYQPFRAYSDVWNSTDGRRWTRVTDRAPWPARIWHQCVAFRNRLWVLGGFRGQPTFSNFGDVWHSRDGAAWEKLETDHQWSARHELSALVHEDKLWVIGGNAWPLVNDVWRLDAPGLTFLSQPVIEEFAGCLYRYEARADFNRAAGPVRYRLVGSPAWLAIDGERGVVTGVPPALGDFAVTIEAFDDAGETARQSYTLHVIPTK